MKKKVFSLLAVVMFSVSFMSSSSYVSEDTNCWEQADIIANDVACEVEEITGRESTHEEWFKTWETAYLFCLSL